MQNSPSPDLEGSNTRLVLTSATFQDPALETEFGQQRLAQTQQQLRRTLAFGAFFFVGFWLTDLTAIGFNDVSLGLLMGRLLLAATVACGLYLVARHPRSLRMPVVVATVAETLAMAVFMLIVLGQPGEMPWHGMSMGTMLLVIYLFIPNAFLPTTAVALTFSVIFAAIAVEVGLLDFSDQVTLFVSLLFTNAFGLLALHRQHVTARQEFLARRIERRNLATQRQFVSMLSHEFRTPLAIIDTVGQRLEATLEPLHPDLLPRVVKIRRAVARLLALLENCLTEERLAASDLVLRPEPVDLCELILLGYGIGGAQTSARLRLLLPDTPQWVNADRHLLDIALSNLVSNALKYSPKDRPVMLHLAAEPVSGQIVIRVEDQGEGVPSADRERIFDKFFRCEPYQGIPGAGLGLHLARELIRRHGGDVTLEPHRAGAGATFVLHLPAFRAANAPMG